MKKNPIMLSEYLNKGGNRKYDQLIFAFSWEERGYESLKTNLSSFEINEATIIEFDVNNYLNKESLDSWRNNKLRTIDLLEDNDIEYTIVKLVQEKFPYDFKREFDTNKSTIIDITTLPKNYILKFAKEFDGFDTIFTYRRGDYRKPTQDELTTSIKKIIPIEGFEGEKRVNSEDFLVLILGFEGHRAAPLPAKFSPQKILPLISIPNEGDSKIDGFYYKTVVNCNYRLLRKASIIKNSDGNYFTVSSLDHVKFFHEITTLIKKYRDKKLDVSICPLGTKAQTLGLYLYWRENPSTQILYSLPVRRFIITSNEKYILKKINLQWVYRI